MEPRPATLITGASAGLGAEFAKACAARGETLILVARRRERLEALAAELDGAEVIVADLAEPGMPARIVAEAADRGLWVQTLINNAGFGLAGRFEALDLARQLEMVDLNMRALTELSHLAIIEMKRRGEGRILNVASTAAFQAGPYMAVYYASKAYVLSFTEALHQELKGSGIKVTALCPGPTSTEFFDVAGAAGSRLARMGGGSREVVAAGLAGLASGRAIVVPGVRNRIGAQASRFLPRAAMRRIIARLKA